MNFTEPVCRARGRLNIHMPVGLYLELVRGGRGAECPGAGRRQITRNTHHRQIIGPVGGNPRVKDHRRIHNRHAQNGAVGQFDNTVVVITNAQFARTAHHPVGQDAAQLAAFDCRRFCIRAAPAPIPIPHGRWAHHRPPGAGCPTRRQPSARANGRCFHARNIQQFGPQPGRRGHRHLRLPVRCGSAFQKSRRATPSLLNNLLTNHKSISFYIPPRF